MSEAADKAEARAGERPADLWRNTDFLKLWVGMNVSPLGTHVTALALPLLAVLTLEATPAQMGLLRASASAAAAVVGPFAGVLADRVRRRPLIYGTDLGLAFLACSVTLGSPASASSSPSPASSFRPCANCARYRTKKTRAAPSDYLRGGLSR